MERVKALEIAWSEELKQDISIIPMGFVSSPKEYGLWVDGTFITAYKHLEEIENYLGIYFLVKED